MTNPQKRALRSLGQGQPRSAYALRENGRTMQNLVTQGFAYGNGFEYGITAKGQYKLTQLEKTRKDKQHGKQ